MMPKLILSCVLLGAVMLPCLAMPESCRFVLYPSSRVGGGYTIKLDGVHSLETCLDFLYNNNDSHVAVSYNRQSEECCVAPVDVPLELTSESGWMTYKTSESGPLPLKQTTTAAITTTKVTASIVPCDDITPGLQNRINSLEKQYGNSISYNASCGKGDNVAMVLFYTPRPSASRKNFNAYESKALCENLGWRLAKLLSPSLVEAAEPLLFTYTGGAGTSVDGDFNKDLNQHVWCNTTIPVPMKYSNQQQKCVRAEANYAKVQIEYTPQECQLDGNNYVLCQSE